MHLKSLLLWLTITLAAPLSALAGDNQYVLGVDGLACPFCAFGIEKRLNEVDGVTNVQIDVGESVVRVTLQEGKKLTEAQAHQAIKEAGFTLRSYSEAAGGPEDNDAP